MGRGLAARALDSLPEVTVLAKAVVFVTLRPCDRWRGGRSEPSPSSPAPRTAGGGVSTCEARALTAGEAWVTQPPALPPAPRCLPLPFPREGAWPRGHSGRFPCSHCGKLSPLLQLCLISLQTGLDLESKYFPLEIRERDKSIRTVTVKAIVSPIPCASAPGWGPKG